MRLFRQIRNPSTWLRSALVAFALGFAVNTAAHAGHAHAPSSVFAQHASCGHCVHFGDLAGAPSYAHEAPSAPPSFRLSLPDGGSVESRTLWLSAKPRAPPDFETR